MAGVHPDDGRPEGEGRRNEIWRRVTETSLRSGVQVLYASDPGQPLTGRRNGDKVGFLGTRGAGRPRCPWKISTRGEGGNASENKQAHLLLPALARVAGLGGALALVVGDLGARHGGEGQVKMVRDAWGDARRRPAIG
jgi:hypothetical protein